MAAERAKQKGRTRAALLAATRALLARGEPAGVAAVAAEAGVSKATAYRYFSDPAVMAAEATLDIEVPRTADLLAGITDPRERVHTVADYHRALPRRYEAAFRAYLAQVLLTWGGHGDETRPRLRGARRVPAFTEALEPVRSELGTNTLDDLVAALSAATGIEQHIVFTDVCGLDASEADRIGAEMVDALLDHYLAPEAG
jgi:AcrR family transcriptional regulator